MAIYDKYYLQEDYFGDPYPELIEVFNGFDRNKKVLDLGCGQGRDSIAIGKLGFNVVGVDVSEVGIKQMNETARTNKLDITGIVSIYTDYPTIKKHDIILMDSMFHFYKKDLEAETKLLTNLLHEVKDGAIIVLVVQYSKQRIKTMQKIIEASGVSLQLKEEKIFTYQEFNSDFYMCVIQKV